MGDVTTRQRLPTSYDNEGVTYMHQDLSIHADLIFQCFHALVFGVPLIQNPFICDYQISITHHSCSRFDYTVHGDRKKRFYPEIRKYYPNLKDGSLEPGYAGIRPKLSGPKQPPTDFVIQVPILQTHFHQNNSYRLSWTLMGVIAASRDQCRLLY